MKNSLLVLFALLIAVSVGFPQSATKIWEVKLEGDPASQPRAVISDTSGCTYLADNYFRDQKYARIRKFSPDGVKLWEWIDTASSGSDIMPKSIAYSITDNSIIVPTTITLNKFSADGELLWRIPYIGYVAAVFGDTIATLVPWGTNGTVVFSDLNGNYVRSFQTYMPTYGFIGIAFKDNFVWISSNSPDGIISNTAAYLAKFTTDGTLLWRWNAPDVNYAFPEIDRDGNAYFALTQFRLIPAPTNSAAYFRLVALDPSGVVSWDREWIEHPPGPANYSNSALSIAVSNHDTSSRQVVLMGLTERSDSLNQGYGQYYARCFKATTGDSLWKLRADYDTTYIVSQYEAGTFTPDGDLVIAGDGFPLSLASTSYLQKFHSTTTEVRELPMGIPEKFSILQNYPNPFNPTTKIRFELPRATHVKLVVYDVLGREMEILWDGEKSPGVYEADWNASQFPSGIYFARFTTPSGIETRKMILIR